MIEVKKPVILIIDDNITNLEVAVKKLEDQGIIVVTARNGKRGLERAKLVQPDLILLDVVMPGIDGFETCHRLKADKTTQDIPVIFMTVLTNKEDILKGFAAGGVDYVTKPLEVEIMMARVKNHLTIRKLQKELQTKVTELDAFARTVAHDLQNPLGIVIGYADYLTNYFSELEPQDIITTLKRLEAASLKSSSIVNELLLLARLSKQDIRRQPLNMEHIVKRVEQSLQAMIEQYGGQLIIPESWPTALGHPPWIEEVWINYVSNGLKYGGPSPRLELGSNLLNDDTIKFWVRDEGPGIPPEDQATLFVEFTRLQRKRIEGYGLGLSIVWRIVEKLGGTVGVESEVGQGSKFYFILPQA